MYEQTHTPIPMKTKMIVMFRTVSICSSLDVAGPKESNTFPIRNEKTGREAPVIAEKMWPKTIIVFSAGVARDISLPYVTTSFGLVDCPLSDICWSIFLISTCTSCFGWFVFASIWTSSTYIGVSLLKLGPFDDVSPYVVINNLIYLKIRFILVVFKICQIHEFK